MDNSPSFSIKSANVSSRVQLYKGIDYNYDGNLDLIKDEFNNLIPNYETSDDWIRNPADTSANALPLDLVNIMPSEVYTFKINVINMGDVDAYIKVVLEQEFLNNDISNFFDISIFKLGDEEIFEKTDDIIYGGRDTDFIKCPELVDGSIKYYPIDLIIKIKFLRYEELSNEIKAQISHERYNNYQGIDVSSMSLFTLILSSSL